MEAPPLAPGHVNNFNLLLDAARNKDLALIQCTDAVTGASVATVCCVNHFDDGSVEFAPIAKLFNNNPYEELKPPAL